MGKNVYLELGTLNQHICLLDGNGETTIFHDFSCNNVKIWNHPIETTSCEWMFQVPGIVCIYVYGV